jgi:dephospho-CoA kinase
MIQRIRGRGDVSPDELQKRIQSAQFEREQAKKHCDAIIDASQSLEHVVEQFKSLV